jgi:hypothetical protein
MNRLLNIGRTGGFPLCAETLGVLNENSEMLESALLQIPLLGRRCAVVCGSLLLTCNEDFRRRLVRIGDDSAASHDACKLVFHTTTHSVHDSQDNVIEDAWREETADIVDELSPALQWRIFRLEDVFEWRLWNDLTGDFAAMLPMSSVMGSGYLAEAPTLSGDGNVMRMNSNRIQLNFALRCHTYANARTVVKIPVPFDGIDGVRLNANLMDSTSANYPVRAMLKGGYMLINIGRWLQDDIHFVPNDTNGGYEECIDIITINQEIIL